MNALIETDALREENDGVFPKEGIENGHLTDLI
jgi:hypothetical protein